MTVSDVLSRYAARFAESLVVSKSVVRLTKANRNVPFAVYYVDLSGKLPKSLSELDSYLDNVVARWYFSGPTSLQWNTYLYFVVTETQQRDPDIQQSTALIQRDRTFARKLVIPESRVEIALFPKTVEPSGRHLGENVFSKWSSLLIEAGLDKAIFTNAPQRERLALIEVQPTTHSELTQPRVIADLKPESFVSALYLSKYRAFPTQRRFAFGAVNLISGANGTGKTSLLEAIELLYCGRNKRNPNSNPEYRLEAEYSDGKRETATQGRTLASFRTKNLNWYGQPEIKTSTLYESFSQFNFLDTDAAVSFADSADRIVEDLSKLLIGPEASKIWDSLQRVNETVENRLRSVRQDESELRSDLASLETRLIDAVAAPQESDAISAHLRATLRRLSWSQVSEFKEELAMNLLGALSELGSLARRAAKLSWATAPVTLSALKQYCNDAKEVAAQSARNLFRIDQARQTIQAHAEIITRATQVADLLERLGRIVSAGVPERIAEQREIRTTLMKYARWLATAGRPETESSLSLLAGASVVAARAAIQSKRKVALAHLSQARTNYEEFKRATDATAVLLQELKQIAAQIIPKSQNPDRCPLCHTEFSVSQLQRHIDRDLDVHTQKISYSLYEELSQSEASANSASAQNEAIDRLLSFCEESEADAGITVGSAIQAVRSLREAQERLQGRLGTVTEILESLDRQGISGSDLESILRRLEVLGYRSEGADIQEVDKLLAAVRAEAGNSREALNHASREVDELTAETQERFSRFHKNSVNLPGSLFALRESIVATETIVAKLGTFSSRFPWPDEQPVSQLAIETDAVRQLASQLQVAAARENQARVTHEALVLEKGSREQKLQLLQKRMQRLDTAHLVLNDIQKNHSLTAAMKQALQENQEGIETIFLGIHSPAEFAGIGERFTTLRRASDGKEASLREISSGQRAAFALSVFLAQNAQLSVGPPLILMDDPIAHVDDLNSLSFLDYLREIVLTSKRQIFFATASDKLASLFERKFDFLGSSQFRHFQLNRKSN